MITRCALEESTHKLTSRKLFVESCDFFGMAVKITIDDVSIRLEKIVDSAKKTMQEISVLDYNKVA